MKLIDVSGGGIHNLVVADQSGRLICYKNTHIEWETRVSSNPSCMTYFYPEQQTDIPLPYISVGCGGSVYIYKIFKAFFQFKLPLLCMEEQEEAAWKLFQKDQNLKQLITSLSKMNKSSLSYKSLEMLCYEDMEKLSELGQKYQDNLAIEDSVTCLEALKKSDDEYAPGCLIIGTERRQLYILNSENTNYAKKFQLCGTPIAICCNDQKSNGKIAILMRENVVQFIIGNEIDRQTIDLSSKPITMIKQGQYIYIATMDRNVYKYNYVDREYQLSIQNNIIGLESLVFGKGKEVKGLLIAQNNQTIQFYIDTQIISTIQLDSNISTMKFGIFGREDGFLVIINNRGGIDTKVLQRQKNYSNVGVQEEEEIKPIELPKFTKLYIEQFQREKDQGTEILRQYQYDLLQMRLKTAQTYLQILDNEQMAPQLSQTGLVRILANVEGLGPYFKLICLVENIGNQILRDLNVTYTYNQNILQLINPIGNLPYLIPKYQRKFEFMIKNVSENGISDILRIIIFQGRECLISTAIQMPMSEIE